ncbi:MAG: hypothetical protein H6560_11880 [Lewinellaceae bacterium]|nr:hypothetical protein [Lewinellaceae bacterium]
MPNLNWSFATIDSLGSAAIFRAAPVFNNVPDLVTYHSYDHTIRLGRNLMERLTVIVRVFFDVNGDRAFRQRRLPAIG